MHDLVTTSYLELIILLAPRNKYEFPFCKVQAQRRSAKGQSHTAGQDQSLQRNLHPKAPRLSWGLSHGRIKRAKVYR